MTEYRIITAARVDEDAQYEADSGRARLDDTTSARTACEETSRFPWRRHGSAARRSTTVLLYGPPGLGKTTLAYVIGNDSACRCGPRRGPSSRTGRSGRDPDNLAEREVLFIDAIHRMPPAIEEILYPALEDYELDIMIGRAPARGR